MRTDLTDITIVLDRSGSMDAVKDDTIGGFNSFLADQKAVPGDATLSLVQFDTAYEPLYTGRPIQEAPPLTPETFKPRGGTALLDAIGRTINATGARLSAIPEADRPGRVIFVIVTDGQENSSTEFIAHINPVQPASERPKLTDVVFGMIKHQTEAYRWEFVFLGANQDAITVAQALSIPTSNALHYASNQQGTPMAFAAASAGVARNRTAPVGTSKSYFSEEERQAQVAAGATK